MDSVLRGTLAMPEIDQIIALVNQSLSDLPDKVSQLQHTLAQGMRRTVLTTVDDDLLEQVYGRAYEHYQHQRYREALPMALYLSISNPRDIRFLFMAGMILQCMNDPLMSATFHACALQLDPTFVPAAFRLAECYTLLGENREAREMLETAMDMGRDSEEFFALQREIMNKLSQMN